MCHKPAVCGKLYSWYANRLHAKSLASFFRALEPFYEGDDNDAGRTLDNVHAQQSTNR